MTSHFPTMRGGWPCAPLALSTLLLAGAPSAHAAEVAPAAPAAAASSAASEPVRPAGRERPLWELGLGAGMVSLPHYRGSDQHRNWVIPVPLVYYRGKIFKSDRDGARAVLFDQGAVDFDLSLAAGAPSNSQHNLARAGMSDLAPTFEIGPNLNWTLAATPRWRVQWRMPVRAAFTLQSRPREIGVQATPSLGFDWRADGWNLGLMAGPIWGSKRYHRYYYEVAEQDARTDRPAYSARSGYAGSQAIAAWSQRQGNRWWGLFVKFDNLHGAAFSDSPLVRERSQWTAGFGVSWVLKSSERQVMEGYDAP